MAVGIARSVQVGIPFRDPHGAYLLTRVGLTVAIFAGLVVVDGLVRTGRPRTVRQACRTHVRSRWTPRRLALAWTALLAYHLTYFTYHNLKSWDVLNAPRDAMLDARGTGGSSSATARPCCCTTCSASTSRPGC